MGPTIRDLKSARRPVLPGVLLVAALLLGAPRTAMTQPSVPPGFRVPSPLSRISWGGRSWFLMGANVAWYHYGEDFGGGEGRGVGDPAAYARLDARFGDAAGAGLHVLRWWTFLGQHLETDETGRPVRPSDGVYADFDAALRLAEQHDLYYVFNLFGNPEDILDRVRDPVKRAALGSAVMPLVARYKDSARILAWEVFNEPDYAVAEGAVTVPEVQETIRVVAAAIHAASGAYVTTATDDVPNFGRWLSLGADFLSLHWYEDAGEACLLCTSAARVQADHPGSGPIVVGEWIANAPQARMAPTDPLARWRYWYDHGYAGAWPWSLFPENTNDGLAVDLAAAAVFSREHDDLGPHR